MAARSTADGMRRASAVAATISTAAHPPGPW
jgi:hypothetical protein